MYETRKKRGIRRPTAIFLALCMVLSLCIQPAGAQERKLIPLGRAVGIKLFSDGALVISVNEENTVLQPGDLLMNINGQRIESTEFLQDYLQKNGSYPVDLQLQRKNTRQTVTILPICGGDGVYRIGAWIRDSMAGIGTLTYYDPATGQYGALGHGITDVDTAVLMSLSSGSIMETAVKAVKMGRRGDPGELRGDFTVQHDVGTLTANTCGGIFGTAADASFFSGTPIDVADATEVTIGDATILATVAGDTPQSYSAQIVRIYREESTMRNLLLRITDPRLLNTTGGIVQGMSGSPILQNGRLVGAVTHVLVNDIIVTRLIQLHGEPTKVQKQGSKIA